MPASLSVYSRLETTGRPPAGRPRRGRRGGDAGARGGARRGAERGGGLPPAPPPPGRAPRPRPVPPPRRGRGGPAAGASSSSPPWAGCERSAGDDNRQHVNLTSGLISLMPVAIVTPVYVSPEFPSRLRLFDQCVASVNKLGSDGTAHLH